MNELLCGTSKEGSNLQVIFGKYKMRRTFGTKTLRTAFTASLVAKNWPNRDKAILTSRLVSILYIEYVGYFR